MLIPATGCHIRLVGEPDWDGAAAQVGPEQAEKLVVGRRLGAWCIQANCVGKARRRPTCPGQVGKGGEGGEG
jgi:hypothetical protein